VSDDTLRWQHNAVGSRARWLAKAAAVPVTLELAAFSAGVCPIRWASADNSYREAAADATGRKNRDVQGGTLSDNSWAFAAAVAAAPGEIRQLLLASPLAAHYAPSLRLLSLAALYMVEPGRVYRGTAVTLTVFDMARNQVSDHMRDATRPTGTPCSRRCLT